MRSVADREWLLSNAGDIPDKIFEEMGQLLDARFKETSLQLSMTFQI